MRAAGVATLLLTTAAIFGFATAVTMIGPLLVDLAQELDVTLSQAGLLAAAMAISWAASAPFAGLLSDRLGRRPLIVLALGGLGVVNLGAGLAPDFWVLMALRFLAGIFGGFGPASVMAAVGDLFPPERRGMAMGWLNMGFSLAAVIGAPSVGAIGGLFGWRWAFAVSGLLMLALALLIRVAFPPSSRSPGASGILATYRAVVGVRWLGHVLVANLLERSVFNLGVLYLPSFLMLSYGLDAVGVAPLLALIAIGTIGGNVLGGWLGDRFPKARLFVAAQILTGAIGLAVFGAPVGLAASAAGGALFGLVNASSRPAMLALGTELSSRHRGAVLGLLSLTNQGGIMLGSTLGGAAVGLGGYPLVAATIAGSAALAAACAAPVARHRA
ncbi:MAG: MFS transporter [Chloroflexota bacterium]|nr:MFS transporter [Chloroflexota bacterium]